MRTREGNNDSYHYSPWLASKVTAGSLHQPPWREVGKLIFLEKDVYDRLLNDLQAYTHLIPTVNLWNEYYYYSHLQVRKSMHKQVMMYAYDRAKILTCVCLTPLTLPFIITLMHAYVHTHTHWVLWKYFINERLKMLKNLALNQVIQTWNLYSISIFNVRIQV